QDITLFYVEAPAVFTVRIVSGSASVEGQKLYIGDGKVAIELVAHATDGIFLQGVKYYNGDQFKNGSTIKVRVGYKKASELQPGDGYGTLAGLSFELLSERRPSCVWPGPCHKRRGASVRTGVSR